MFCLRLSTQLLQLTQKLPISFSRWCLSSCVQIWLWRYLGRRVSCWFGFRNHFFHCHRYMLLLPKHLFVWFLGQGLPSPISQVSRPCLWPILVWKLQLLTLQRKCLHLWAIIWVNLLLFQGLRPLQFILSLCSDCLFLRRWLLLNHKHIFFWPHMTSVALL